MDVIQSIRERAKSGSKKIVLPEVNDDIEKAEIVDITNFENMNAYVTELVKLREKKGMTPEKAKEILSTDRLYFGAMMVRFGDVDGMVAGSIAATADVLRASIQIIGSKPGIKTLSSCFLMVLPEEKKEFGEDGVMIFSDCGVVPNPTSEQLVDIAIGASESARIIANIDPKVLQGFAKPVNDLSRGCSVEDIVNVVAITSCSCEDTNCAC